MFGLYAMDGVRAPFRTVALHGLVRDKFGKKMSKSRGQHRRPARLDGRVRLRRAALHPGPRRQPRRRRADQRGVGRRAAATSATSSGTPPGSRCSTAPRRGRAAGSAGASPSSDRWILSRLAAVTAEVDAAYEDFQFAKASEALYHFAWDERLRLVPGAGQAAAAARGRRGGRASPGGCSARCWTRCCGCCTRSSRSSPRSCGPR